MSSNKTRRLPAVAGMFYPDNSSELRREIENSFFNSQFGPGRIPPNPTKKKIYGMISPHAGYVYSGAVAANGYYAISATDFDNAIIVGPNHYGIGSGAATMKEGIWETPLGDIEIDSEFSLEISRRSGIVDFDDFAHSKDHCLEVQIPFLQYIRRDRLFKIAPVVMILQDQETAIDVGRAIAETVTEKNEDISQTILIGSSDLTHYEPNEEAHRKDNELIKSILSLDVSKFYSTLERMNVSACGYGAIASVMTAAKQLGATKGELLRYATSGDVTGDKVSVVGYSSIIFV